MKGSSIKRKPAKKKARPADPCWWSNRCKTRAPVVVGGDERYCHKHATWTADALVGTFVKERDGYRCQLVGFNDEPCWGDLAWCHLIPKGRYGGTRWIPENAVAGCAGHHKAFDESPLEKDEWCADRLGPRWDELKLLARTTARPSVGDIIREYREKAA